MKKSGFVPVIVFGLLVVASLSVMYWKDVGEKVITVSSTVDGRELPIYCVETEKTQIAISFDAAWGNEETQEILCITVCNSLHTLGTVFSRYHNVSQKSCNL